MKNTDKINRQFEQKNLNNIKRNQAKVKKAYQKAIDKIFAGLPKIKPQDKFDITRLPQLSRLVDNVLAKWNEEVITILLNGIHESWELSGAKLNEVIRDYAIGKELVPLILDQLKVRNLEAYESFLNRKAGPKGLNLSQRVWNYHNQFRFEIENNLAMGIKEGRSAAEMARDQKRYLVEPDRLFRRIRNHEGKLVLSKAAKSYNPGQGVYRSSYKNALRLTRTETNMAYRTADHHNYNAMPMVMGFEVKLSARHPRPDICDHLKGKYPKTFKFVGWHPQCLCFTVPIMASNDEFLKFIDAHQEDKDYNFQGMITENPPQLNEYILKNKDTIKKYIYKPYWIKDNGININ